eukprot:6491433-Amphidinium_carterae.2
MQNKQTTSLVTTHNKKRKLRKHTKVQHCQHNEKWMNTTSLTYLTETGANTVYKAKADHNIINEEG